MNIKQKTKLPHNPINPSHYHTPIQPLDFIEANGMNFLEGNIIKYITRYKKKNGLEDLKKAQFYLNRLIENYGTNEINTNN